MLRRMLMEGNANFRNRISQNAKEVIRKLHHLLTTHNFN